MSEKEIELESILKLIKADKAEFSFLEKLEPSEIIKLKTQIVEAANSNMSDIFSPFAKVSKFLPNFLNAKATEEILGAKIAANLSYHLPPDDAIGIANHFSTKFFADVLENLVPEKIEEMIKKSSHDLMRKAVNELLTRKNYSLIGSLIDFTPLDSVEKIAKSLNKSEDLILISYYCKNKPRLLNLFETKFDDNLTLKSALVGLGDEYFKYYKEIYKDATDSLFQKTLNLVAISDSNLKEKFSSIKN